MAARFLKVEVKAGRSPWPHPSCLLLHKSQISRNITPLPDKHKSSQQPSMVTVPRRPDSEWGLEPGLRNNHVTDPGRWNT
ncbi:hypothetical protein JZ751_009591 [Albula glossodonta]|uniref:Uncharacterized protein n=1 Tax=Albula glossodonta TaxID=121402 RepID=A0A8T2P021_9TELE|nr:hypothetical protein JZ751_009591 [Albula glossodonta]